MNKEPKFKGGMRQADWIQRYIRNSNCRRSDFNAEPKLELSMVYFGLAVFVILMLLVGVGL